MDRKKRSEPLNNSSDDYVPVDLGPKKKPKIHTTAGDILLGMSVHIARHYLFIKTYYRLIAYSVFIFVFSLLAPYLGLSRTFYFAQKTNFLNVYFVKFGWGWTLLVTGAFVYFTSLVYSSGDLRNVRQQLARLITGTVLWFLVTAFFGKVEKSTAYCKGVKLMATMKECKAAGGTWYPGFDISGHCFLLIFCCLIIAEEVKVFRNWDRMRLLLDSYEEEPPELQLLSAEDVVESKRLHDQHTLLIKALFLCLFALHLIWEVMLIITVLYYHTFMHKVLGTLCAYLCWYVSYGLWFRTKFSPGLPGHCKIRYSNWKRSSK